MNKSIKTFWYYYEKFRAFFLVLLMILCIVQIGILWSRQSGSLPFLSAFFPDSKISSQPSLEDSKGDYLLPYRVVLSTGYDGDHFIVPNGSKDYQTLWNGAKQYLAQVLNSKPKNTAAFNEDTWGSLAASKPYFFEFKTQIPADIAKWVLNLPGSSGEGLPGIYKMIICPDDPDNGYYDTVDIRDDSNIYTYDIPDFKGSALGQEEFRTVYAAQKKDPNSRNYQLAFEKLKSTTLPKDMFIPLTNNSTQKYSNLNCTTFTYIGGQSSDLSEYDEIAKGLFGEARNDFYPDEDVYGSIVFKKADSVYRLYKNSILEYRYTDNRSSSDRTKILDAYKNAAGFIMEQSVRGNFMKGVNVYLASVEEGDNSYIFNFDFTITDSEGNGEVPIQLKNYTLPDKADRLDHGISVEATSKRVVHCEWLVLKLKDDKAFRTYTWNYGEALDLVSGSYADLDRDKAVTTDYGIYYVLKESNTYKAEVDISPSFVLFAGGKSYDVALAGK